jgi:serine/threonine-protein kinase RsbW
MPKRNAPVAIPARGPVDLLVTTMTYPGTASNVSEARHWLRDILRNSPRAYDAELVAAEFMSNAIRHTPSGDDGGTFTITIQLGSDRARIEVLDLGGARCDGSLGYGLRATGAPVASSAEGGRGLRMVTALADDYGHEMGDTRVHICWALLTW